MKKLITSFAILASVVAQAEYMYWSVSDGQIDDSIFTEVEYIRVGYVTANGQQPAWQGQALTTYDTAGESMEGADVLYNSGARYSVDLTGLTTAAYSFYIEVLNENHTVIGRTGVESSHTYTTYAQLQEGNYIATGDIGTVQSVNVWHGGAISAVPEPSSMALLALGAGLVGLRRKLKKGKKAKKETLA